MTAQSIITFSMKATLDNILTIHDEKIFNLLLNPKLIYLSVFSMRSNFNFDEYYKVSQKFKFALFADCIGQNLCKNYFNESFYKSNDIIISKILMQFSKLVYLSKKDKIHFSKKISYCHENSNCRFTGFVFTYLSFHINFESWIWVLFFICNIQIKNK